MFKDIAKTIYQTGKILFFVFIIIGIILFIEYGVANDEIEMAVLLGLSSVLGAFLVALPLCGFGKLIQDVTILKSLQLHDK